jgi:lon-related putative ATP-dependent protease
MSTKLLELSAEALQPRYDASSFPFTSTVELEPLTDIVGQDRALQAIDFGTSIDSFGYNLFVMGPPGSGRTTAVTNIVRGKAGQMPAPSDWCYVYNFKDPNVPRALGLPAGIGPRFRTDMEELGREVGRRLERAFEGEAYRRERGRLAEELRAAQKTEFQQLEELARKRNFAVQQVGQMFGIVPVVDGEPLTPEKYEQLEAAARQRIDQEGQELRDAVAEAMRRLRTAEKEVRKNVEELDRRVALMALGDLIQELTRRYAGHQTVTRHLGEVQDDILSHLQDFLRSEEEDRPHMLAGLPLPSPPDPWERYQVNVLVANDPAAGAPVIEEYNPTFYNLVGRIEHRVQFGAMSTDFSLIKAGALHRANGGFLILSARDLLTGFMAWDVLKRALRSQSITIEDINQQFRLVSTMGLEPEPIPVRLRVILIGTPFIYSLLYSFDEDFRKLFKVQVDFDDRMAADTNTVLAYGRFIAVRTKEEGLPHFSRDAVAEVVRFGSRLVEDQRKLASTFSVIGDIVRESAYWSRKNGHDLVGTEDVRQALQAREYRANRIEERLRELITEGTILIDTDGDTVGQLNGIAIVGWGDYDFGKPTRITARTFVGQAGVVNIEREVKLAGRIHNKGVMILTGYLGGRYARERPLTLSASLGFEQSYEEIEGDSASSAELYALLSSIGNLPIHQSLAVTGSVNQHGEVQPVGSVSRKVEGFFHCCRLKGLTGRQGVIIPRRNVHNLVLTNDVVEAVRRGEFHIYAIDHIDEGFELLTGLPAGERQSDGSYPEGTVNCAVAQGLSRLHEAWKEFGEHAGEPAAGPEEEEEEHPPQAARPSL